MKLLKLVYIAHGWHLGLTQTPLIDESVEAWRYGPVIPSLYRRFKTYGNQPIPVTEVAENVQLSNPERLTPFLESVWNAYKDYTGLQLSSMTHAQGTPWYQVWEVEGGKHYMGADIPPQMIQKHYMEKAANAA
ncbi:Panacea domain-containing protein [Luteolibacter luteus]|nr:type II toxin-antitoxin system antitoxin SocA domain-containing protein [Luteolibacter luteus]